MSNDLLRKMDCKESEIPIWPEALEGKGRQMSFLFGEPRWYLWMQEENKQALSSLRRDLLLLHQNGDLSLFRGKNAPAPGTYITALHEGRMIRGRILSSENRLEDPNSSRRNVTVIDVDEGKTLNLPSNQVRILPPEMKTLPCQAIRCDINLDCAEQFDWPQQITTMLHKALRNSILIVENRAKRPGSIPTISANITIVNPASGEVFHIAKWLLDSFSSHLDLCSFEQFKPFPVGMTNTQLELLQSQMLRLNLQPSPTGFPLLPTGARPMLPPPTGAMHYQNSMQPLALMSPSPLLSPEPTFAANAMSFPPTSQVQSPYLYPNPSLAPLPAFSGGESSSAPWMSSCNSSLLSVSVNSKPAQESVSSASSHSTVGIDLDLKSTSSSLVSSSLADAPFYPKMQTATFSSTEDEPDEALSLGRGSRRKRARNHAPSSSSSLSAEAAPFVPKFSSRKESDLIASKNEDRRTIKATSHIKETPVHLTEKTPNPVERKDEVTRAEKAKPGPSMPKELTQKSLGSLKKSQDGQKVSLVQVIRKWEVGHIVHAVMAHMWNPSCFEVNVVDEFSGSLISVEEEMKQYYQSNRITLSSKQQAKDLCGDYCACYDADDDVWFRASVDEWFVEDSVTPVRVWAVDLGGYFGQDLNSIQPLATDLAKSLPVLVTLCSMKNILPRSNNGIWPEIHLNQMREKLPVGKEIYLRIDGPMSKENIWPVSVFTNPKTDLDSINEILVAEGCASYIGSQETTEEQSLEEQIYEDHDNPMEEAYNAGHENYEHDDEDACVAVSGRTPKEEIGICWNYNRDGHCYKKFCELKHVRLDPEGYSIAKEEVYVEPFTEIGENVLSPGKLIKLKVSRIMTVNHFIAVLCLKKGSAELQSMETLSSVLRNLNSTEKKRSLKTFTEFPADGEIVLAKDKAGNFYRGRIICSSQDDDDLYEVLNVDTGVSNSVALQDLRRVDPAFLHHPFHAIECWLADVTPVASDREWIKTCNSLLADLVNKKTMTALIVRSDPWGLEINLFDDKGKDIAVALKEMGVVKDCPMRHLPLSQSRYKPG